ncbi:MAG: hypothetical protein IJM41_02800 [Bacteroidales bacterium]|nr:hypothetical protein [Bacteroidales bacterium]
MSKYTPLWEHIRDNGIDRIKLSFADIESVLGFPIDHSFLNFKKELDGYGYSVVKISLKEKSVLFDKLSQ